MRIGEMCVGWKKVLRDSESGEDKRPKHTPQELWHDVSLLNYCFIVSLPTFHIPVDSWLFRLFVFVLSQKLEKLKWKWMHFCSKRKSDQQGFCFEQHFSYIRTPKPRKPLTAPFIHFSYSSVTSPPKETYKQPMYNVDEWNILHDWTMLMPVEIFYS